MSLKEYLQLLESKFAGAANKAGKAVMEIELCEKFIKLVEEEKIVFLERTLAEISQTETQVETQ